VAASGRRTTGRTAAVGILIVVVGLAAVVLASRGVPGDRTAAAYSASVDDRTMLAAFLAVATIATVLVIWAAWPDDRASFREPARSWWRQYLLSLVVLLLFVLGGAAREQLRARDPGVGRELPPPGAESDDRNNSDNVRRLPASGTASAALGIATVAAAIAFAGIRLAQRRRAMIVAAGGHPRPSDGLAGPDDAALVVPEQLHEADLAAEPDARRAVQLTYALLERRLAATLAARPAAATPQEWLAVLRRSAPPGGPDAVPAARLLTRLYEQARFADDERHPVTPSDRDEAIHALRALSAALAQPSTSSGGRVL
jgi:hypothetical protein